MLWPEERKLQTEKGRGKGDQALQCELEVEAPVSVYDYIFPL